MALEVGIVGLPSSGKSTLFHALTGTHATGDVGMASIPDERLRRVAEVVGARKVTPAAIRVRMMVLSICRLSVVGCQLSVVSCRLSIADDPL